MRPAPHIRAKNFSIFSKRPSKTVVSPLSQCPLRFRKSGVSAEWREGVKSRRSKGKSCPAQRKMTRIALLALALMIASCATQPRYADQVLGRPLPTTTEAKAGECGWLRGEIARQQSIAGVGTAMATTPVMAAAYQAQARQNIAALETRASRVGCEAAFRSDTPPRSMDACIADCKRLTSRTPEQCFDSCSVGR